MSSCAPFPLDFGHRGSAAGQAFEPRMDAGKRGEKGRMVAVHATFGAFFGPAPGPCRGFLNAEALDWVVILAGLQRGNPAKAAPAARELRGWSGGTQKLGPVGGRFTKNLNRPGGAFAPDRPDLRGLGWGACGRRLNPWPARGFGGHPPAACAARGPRMRFLCFGGAGFGGKIGGSPVQRVLERPGADA